MLLGIAVVTAVASAVAVPPASAVSAGLVPDSAPDEATAALWAQQGDKPVVVSSATTETSETVANPDGSWTLTEYTHPVRVKQGATWAPIDTTLVKRADGSVGPKATTVDLALNPGGAGSSGVPIVTAGDGDGHSVGLVWTSDLPVPTLAGDTATYAEVLPGVDLQVEAVPEGYMQKVVVKTREAADNPALATIPFGLYTKNTTVDLAEGEGHGTPTDSTEATDGFVVKDPEGKVLFDGDASRMWDSAGEGSEAEAQLGEGGGRHESVMEVELTDDQVKVSPNQEFLDDPETQYPVTLDPDNWCTSCGIQAHVVVQSGYPAAHNYNATAGDLSDLKAGYENYDAAGVSRSYIQMNAAQFAGTVVKSASLNATVLHSYNCSGTSPTDLWLAGAIDGNTTWNAQPIWGSKLGSSNVANCNDAPNVIAQFDATAGAQTSANQRWPNVTFMLIGSTENSVSAWRRFALNPYLQVNYNSYPNTPWNLTMQHGALKCVQGANRPWIQTKTPQLAGLVSDPDGGTLFAGFALGAGTAGHSTNVHDNAGSLVTVGTPGPNQAATAQFAAVPAGWITGDGIYNWSMQVNDGQLWSPWVGSCEFYVDSTVPLAPTVSMTGTSPAYQGDTAHFSVSVGMATANFYDIDHFIYTTDGSEPQPQGSPSITATKATDASGKMIATANLSAIAVNGNQNYIKVKAVNKAGTPGPDATCVASGNLDAPSCTFHVLPFTPAVGLVGAWPLDEMGGRVLADTANTTPDNAGLTVHGAELLGGGDWIAGYDHGNSWTHPDTGGYSEGTKGALTLDGSSGYVDTTTGPVADTTKSFSVGAWAKLNNTNGYQTVVSQDGNQASGFYLQYSKADNAWAFSMTTADQANATTVRAKSTSPPTVGVWTHLVGTYDASTGTTTLYVDGVKQSTSVGAGWASTGRLVIGAAKFNGVRTDYLAGQVDDVQVWQRVLSAQEAHDFANAPAPVSKFGLAEGCVTALGTTAPSLQSSWALDEGSGATANDTSPFGNAMTLNNGYTWTTGQQGSAVHFDGTGAYANAAPPVDTTQSFTVSAWAKLDDLNGYYTLLSQGGTNEAAFQLRYSPDVKRWVFGMTSADDNSTDLYHWAIGSQAPQAGVWTLLTGVFDQSTMRVRLYVNGKLEGQNVVPTAWSAVDTFTVGAYLGVNNFFKGSVDRVQVWGQALTDDQIASLAGFSYFDSIRKTTGTGSGPVSLTEAPDACSAQFPRPWTGQVDAGRPAGFRTDRSYTVEAWVYHRWTSDDVAVGGAVDPNGRAVVGVDDSQYSPILLGYHSWNDANGTPHPKWTLLVSNSTTGPGAWYAISDADAANNTWVHLAATYDASTHTIALYVNGVKQHTYANTPDGGGVTSRASTGTLFLGRGVWSGQSSDGWYGGLAGVRIYQGVRGGGDIAYDAKTDDPGSLSGVRHL
ncbi:LamG-like jellyroll fold domain-containing protein [Amycolatopsis tucumanensis]|uniref:LamG-like jellyroll fold domain-containing protein n=1 Tax=Amycolatopsis tucumanensis TaxID=401106 RepID=UPI003D732E82